MAAWEYKLLKGPLVGFLAEEHRQPVGESFESELNALGSDGWEVATTIGPGDLPYFWVVLKRPLVSR